MPRVRHRALFQLRDVLVFAGLLCFVVWVAAAFMFIVEMEMSRTEATLASVAVLIVVATIATLLMPRVVSIDVSPVAAIFGTCSSRSDI